MDFGVLHEMLDALGVPSTEDILRKMTPEEKVSAGNSFAMSSTFDPMVSVVNQGDRDTAKGYAVGLLGVAVSVYCGAFKGYEMGEPLPGEEGSLAPMAEEALETFFQKIKAFDQNRRK